MNYATEFKRFATSQYIYSAVRISLAIVVPSLILAYLGLLKEYFLFPLATSFVGLTDQPGPFTRRRNALLLATLSFFVVAIVAGLLKDYPLLIYAEIIVFGLFFTMIGVYGQRLAAVGSLALVVMAIFIDGHLTGDHLIKSVFVLLAGSLCYVLIFLIVSKIQPYKLAAQLIGENYLELGDYLRLKSKFYQPGADFSKLTMSLLSQQIKLKNLQEDTRETVFKTRKIVNEATTTSRVLMLMFLNSIDLHEKLMTSESDYEKLQKNFASTGILTSIGDYLEKVAGELTNIGIALQSGTKAAPVYDINTEFENIYEEYSALRHRFLKPENLDQFMVLRLILDRVMNVTDDLKMIYRVFQQDVKLAKSLSTGLDIHKFVPESNKLNFQVFKNNLSLKSSQFKHAIRVVLALLIGFSIANIMSPSLGHSYWILITILAIMRPAYATTKHRNLLRLYGTVAGAVLAYILLMTVDNTSVLFGLLLLNMILCFSFLKANYFWAVLFMTVYIFLTFNFLNPGNVNLIFRDRILDTAVAGVVAFGVSYFVLPVWEHTQNRDLMTKCAASNLKYFKSVMSHFIEGEDEVSTQQYKLDRKDAVIDLANLSDNFQRMISDPKNQQRKMEHIHQYVNTSHLITAYIASFFQYVSSDKTYAEIDFKNWKTKIAAQLAWTKNILEKQAIESAPETGSDVKPSDIVADLMDRRRQEIFENEISDRRDPHRITRLTELKNLQEILELIYDAAKEQRKVAQKIAEED